MTNKQSGTFASDELIVFTYNENNLEIENVLSKLTETNRGPETASRNLKSFAFQKSIKMADNGHSMPYAVPVKLSRANPDKPVITEGIRTAIAEQVSGEKKLVTLVPLGGIANHLFGAGHGNGPMPMAAAKGDARLSMKISLPPAVVDPQFEDATPKQVHVFVLDTLPRDLKIMQEDFASDTTEYPPDSAKDLMRKVIKGSNFRSLPYDPETEDHLLPDDDNVTLFDAHGLCVAGVIKSIAPEAQLHMIRVLNNNGVGSLKTLIQGMNEVKKILATIQKPNVEAVINMSLIFNLPTKEALEMLQAELSAQDPNLLLPEATTDADDHDAHAVDEDDVSKLAKKCREFGLHSTVAGKALDELVGILDHYEDTMAVLNTIINVDFGKNSKPTLVAAAGNFPGDGNDPDNQKKLWTRFPANTPGVFGVGATKRKLDYQDVPERADYTMDPDDEKADEGIFTFGGDLTSDDLTDKSGFILGLYTNRRECCWWAGTSIASAIVSGALAQHLSKGGTKESFKAAMDKKIGNYNYLEADQTFA